MIDPMLFRLICLIAIVGMLVVFVLQNAVPTLALVFLGIQFPPLPVSWWLLGAMAVGGATTLVIRILFGLSNFVTGRAVRSRVQSGSQREPFDSRATASGTASRRNAETQTQGDAAWRDWRGYESADRPTADHPTAEPVDRRSADAADDWERPLSENWDAQDLPQPSARKTRLNDTDLRNFEAKQAPPQASQSGSVYSYSYREPIAASERQSQPVVDADYRVLVPPHPSMDEVSPPPAENADDWFEEPSDEFK